MAMNFDNPWLNLGIGLLSQPTFGTGLLSGVQLASQQHQAALQAQRAQQQIDQTSALNDAYRNVASNIAPLVPVNPGGGPVNPQDQAAMAMMATGVPDLVNKGLSALSMLGNSERSNYYQALPVTTTDAKGNPVTSYYSFDARRNKAVPIPGLPGGATAPQFSPPVQGAIAGAKTTETAKATAKTGAQISLPQTEFDANYMIDLLDKLKNHPGLNYTTGWYSGLPTIPGTAQASVRALLDQIKGKTFLQAYQTLKGGGQITEVEGQKATDALNRLKTAQSTQDVVNAASEFQNIIKNALERARNQAQGNYSPVPLDNSVPTPSGFKYIGPAQ